MDLKAKAEGLTEEKYLLNLCKKDSAKRRNLIEKWKNIDIVSRKMLDLPEISKQVDRKNQSNFVLYNMREESYLMSLFVFLVSILLLLIDAIPVKLHIAVPFTWFFLFDVVAFSILVWVNQFSHNYNNVVETNRRHLGLNILCGLISLILAPTLCVILLFLPFGSLSIVLAILAGCLITMFTCMPMFDKYWQVHRYPRTIALKHVFYFVISAIIGTAVVVFMEAYYPYPVFLKNLEFFYIPEVLRGFLFSVLLLDLLFVPLYGGYMHMKIDEFRIIRQVKKRISLYDKNLDEAVEELYSVICDLQSSDSRNIEKQETGLNAQPDAQETKGSSEEPDAPNTV